MKKYMLTAAMLSLALLPTASFADMTEADLNQAKVASTGDHKAQIQGYATNWVNAYNNHDVVTLMKIYTPDAQLSSPSVTLSGTTDIAGNFKKEFEAGTFKFTSVTTDYAKRTGDISVSSGSWTADMRGADGKLVPVSGHWMTAGKCSGNDCWVTNHMINMQMPVTQ
jgi:ketosteroid isomerase-like protein